MALTGQKRKTHAVMCAVSSVLWLLALIFIMVVFINFIKRYKNYKSKSRAPLRLATAILILMTLAGINFLYARILKSVRYSGNDDDDKTIDVIGDSAGAAFTIMVFGLILITFVLRLKNVFKGTKYDYPAWFYICMYVEIIITVLAAFVGEGLGMAYIQGIALFLMMFNCIFLTYLFYRSLKKIMSSTGYDNLIKVMVKFIVLVSLCMLSSFAFAVSLILEGIFTDTDMEEPFTYMVWIIQCIDGPINVTAIYFQFQFADDHYFKLLGKWHDWIGITFFGIAAIEKNVAQEMSIDTTNAVASQSPATNESSM